jgi:sugar/nucleoside kinase (ribokinase family)
MESGKKGIIFAGTLLVDQLKFIEAWPEETTLTKITRQTSALGGLACNCPIDMAKLAPEVPVSVMGIVGDDPFGDFILEGFSKYPSIDTSLIKREGETSYTDVMTTPDGRRTFFAFQGANAMLGPGHFDFTNIEAYILHIGYVLILDTLDGPDPDYPTAMCRVLDNARSAGILTSVDVVSESGDRFKSLVRPVLAYTDILSINDFEAEGVTGIKLRDEKGNLIHDALQPCAKELASYGVKKWVCIHMPEISVGIDIKSGAYTENVPPDVPRSYIKSSVGAGDAFTTGLLYSAYRGISLDQAISAANAVATFSLSGIGASDAIRPLNEILSEMEKYTL